MPNGVSVHAPVLIGRRVTQAVGRSRDIARDKMNIIVFLHGTAIMHRNALGRTREERIRQVREQEASVHDYISYVPVGDAVRKLRAWAAQGATIMYLSSHQDPSDLDKDQLVLRTYGFPEGEVFIRQADETYQDIVERILPGILIEDDCESIGGEQEMTYPHINPTLKPRIKSIVVKEFSGIDHLPDDVRALEDAS
jgi:hypothetical protein